MFKLSKKISAIALVFMLCLTACGNNDSEESSAGDQSNSTESSADTTSFEENGDYLTGYKWKGDDGSLIDLAVDETFRFYQTAENTSNNYYTGTFQVINGQNAINYIINEYGFSEDAQRSVMEQYAVDDKYYYVLVLNIDECIVDEKNTLDGKSKTEYFGYYNPEEEHLNFTSLKTMGQMDFYKQK